MAGPVTEFAEGAFQDVAGLLYGSISTLTSLIASPTLGPLRVSMRRRRFGATQTAPHVLSFLVFVLLLYFIKLTHTPLDATVGTLLGLNSAPIKLRTLLLGSFVAAVVFDAALRITLAIKLRGRNAKQRSRMLQRLLYSGVLLCTVALLFSLSLYRY